MPVVFLSRSVTHPNSLKESVNSTDRNERHVAFSAHIPEQHGINASPNAIVPFTSVITNIGNALNPHTAVFTAPYDGDYFFAVYVDVTGGYKGVSVRKNNVLVVHADADDTVSTRRSVSAVVSLRAGDVVTVNQGDGGGVLDDGVDSVFTGFLIR